MPATPVSVERLRELQEEARLLVARWGLRTAESASLGRYLVAGFRIPAGELAMLLPPNRILAFSEVTQFNTVIQARAGLRRACGVGEAGRRDAPTPRRCQVRHSAVLAERLYSASLTGDDLDNFLSHACDPACGLVVDADLAVRLRARRDVPPGEPLSIDCARRSAARRSAARALRRRPSLTLATSRRGSRGGHAAAGRAVRLRVRSGELQGPHRGQPRAGGAPHGRVTTGTRACPPRALLAREKASLDSTDRRAAQTDSNPLRRM